MTITQGIKFLEKHPNQFKDFQHNLANNKCVTCGLVPLSECDCQFGMCSACIRTVTLTASEFDQLNQIVVQQRQKQKKINLSSSF